MADDFDHQDEAVKNAIAVFSFFPVIGSKVSTAAKLGLQAWGKRKVRRFVLNFELLMRELAQREGVRPDDAAWFKERLSDPKVESATEKGFDLLLRARDASARLSIARLYAAYVGGSTLTWLAFSRYGDFLAASDKYSIEGALAIVDGMERANANVSMTFAEVTATNIGGDRALIIRGTVAHREPLSSDIRKVITAMTHLKRALIGTEGSGGGLGNSGPGVIRFLEEELQLLLGLRPYLLIDQSVSGQVLTALRCSATDGLSLEDLLRHVDEAIAGGVDLGEFEEALNELESAQRIVIESVRDEVFVRLQTTSTD